MTRTAWLAVAIMVVGMGTAAAQERDLSSPFFDCPFINYFDSGCPELEKESPQAAPRERPQAEQPASEAEGEEENEWSDENPELLLPLFPREKPGGGHAGVVPDAPCEADVGECAAIRALVRAAHAANTRRTGADRPGRR